MADLPITGRCLCGAVRFAVDAPLQRAMYCHCTRCQRRTGTASSISARVVPGSLRVTAGDEHIRAWTPPDGFAKCFCALCGGHLWSHDPERPEILSVRLGAIDGDPGVRPSLRQFTAYAPVWEPIPDDGLPRHPERAPS